MRPHYTRRDYRSEGDSSSRPPSDIVSAMQVLPKSFYDRDAESVARDLLGKHLVRRIGRLMSPKWCFEKLRMSKCARRFAINRLIS